MFKVGDIVIYNNPEGHIWNKHKYKFRLFDVSGYDFKVVALQSIFGPGGDVWHSAGSYLTLRQNKFIKEKKNHLPEWF